jgi:hypothetical protein
MGNDLANIPSDPRIERCMETYDIPPYKIKVLLEIYKLYDSSGKGNMLMVEEFCTRLLDFPRSPLTDAIPGFMETRSEIYLAFGEFVDVVCTFACMEQMELIKFVWYILDPRKVGTIETHVIKVFFYSIWYNKPYSNVPQALAYLKTIDEDGVYNYRELESLLSRYPFVFSPVYQLQQHIVSRTLGESWWAGHKSRLTNVKLRKHERAKKLAEKLKREQQEALEGVTDAMVRHKMGVRYHICPWTILRVRKRMVQIVAMENELEHQFIAMQKKQR